MNHVKKILGALVAFGTIITSSAHGSSEGKHDAIWEAVHHNSFRTDADMARDIYRHPEAVLRFAGLTKSMTVAEINPGGGWYSRILAPLLKDNGVYVGLEHNPAFYKSNKRYYDRLMAYPSSLEKDRAMYGPHAIASWIPASEGLPLKAGTLDAAFVVRAMHNWWRRGFFDEGLEQLHSLLKQDGILIIIQHRVAETMAGDRTALAQKGRWKQSDMIKALEERGFRLLESSEINANPKDGGGYPGGVWSLPPVSNGDQSVRDYKAIGESDRMTLKFIKVADGS